MMGCGAAKAIQVEETNHTSNGNAVKDKLIYESNGINGTTERRVSRPMTPVPKPVAFEIPIDENQTNSETNGVKKLPPKRFTEQSTQQLTAEELHEKQLRAEEKRLGILGEKKLKAQKYNEKFLVNNNSNNTNNINSIKESGNDIIENENATQINGINGNND